MLAGLLEFLGCEGGFGQFGQIGCGICVDSKDDKVLIDAGYDAGREFAVGLIVDLIEDKAVWIGGVGSGEDLEMAVGPEVAQDLVEQGGPVFESWVLGGSGLLQRHQDNAVRLLAPAGGEKYEIIAARRRSGDIELGFVGSKE